MGVSQRHFLLLFRVTDLELEEIPYGLEVLVEIESIFAKQDTEKFESM